MKTGLFFFLAYLIVAHVPLRKISVFERGAAIRQSVLSTITLSRFRYDSAA
jgi:hypothetical protein